MITTGRSRSPRWPYPAQRGHSYLRPPTQWGRRDRDEHRRCIGQRGRGLVPRDPSGGRATPLRADRVGGLRRTGEQPTLPHGGTWRPAVPDAPRMACTSIGDDSFWSAPSSRVTYSQGQLDASTLTKAGYGSQPKRGSDRHRALSNRAAMEEAGLDLSKEFTKPLTADAVEVPDVVVTMDCGDACPIFHGERYVHGELTDASGKSAEEVARSATRSTDGSVSSTHSSAGDRADSRKAPPAAARSRCTHGSRNLLRQVEPLQ